MYKSSKKDKKPSKEFLSDVSINDFANTSVGNGGRRLKKGAMTNLSTKIKSLKILDDDRPWDEKLNDLIPNEGDLEEQLSVKSSRRKEKHKLEAADDDVETGLFFPNEIWYRIAEFIDPEDVASFAGISRVCRAITYTANFWFSLYKRFYKPVDNMPEELKPNCMARRYGLRSLVIRSLYYTYFPKINHNKMGASPNTDSLLKMCCVDFWSKKGRSGWVYTFKLKGTEKNSIFGRRSEVIPKPNLLEMLDDINANVDENCKILQVLSCDYCPLPMVIGHVLISVKCNMSQKCQYFHLHLTFSNGPSSYPTCPISIDGMQALRVINWWHPAFPRSNHLDKTLFSDEVIPNCDFST